jgi:hypothetical protein
VDLQLAQRLLDDPIAKDQPCPFSPPSKRGINGTLQSDSRFRGNDVDWGGMLSPAYFARQQENHDVIPAKAGIAL